MSFPLIIVFEKAGCWRIVADSAGGKTGHYLTELINKRHVKYFVEHMYSDASFSLETEYGRMKILTLSMRIGYALAVSDIDNGDQCAAIGNGRTVDCKALSNAFEFAMNLKTANADDENEAFNTIKNALSCFSNIIGNRGAIVHTNRASRAVTVHLSDILVASELMLLAGILTDSALPILTEISVSNGVVDVTFGILKNEYSSFVVADLFLDIGGENCSCFDCGDGYIRIGGMMHISDYSKIGMKYDPEDTAQHTYLYE